MISTTALAVGIYRVVKVLAFSSGFIDDEYRRLLISEVCF